MNYDLSPARLLLRRAPFLPDESLPSLTVRLALLNRCSFRNLRKLFFGFSLEQFAVLDRPRHTDTYLRLARFTGLSALELFIVSINRFAPFLKSWQETCDLIRLDGQVVQMLPPSQKSYPQVRGTLNAQFCPHCLREAPYHRLLWSIVDVAACLRHRCLLIESCPACGNDVSIESVVMRRCKKCGADLRAASAVSLGADRVGLWSQKAIQSWLMSTGDGLPLPSTAVEVTLFRLASVMKIVLMTPTKRDLRWYVHGRLDLRLQDCDPRSNWAQKRGFSSAWHYATGATVYRAMARGWHGFNEFEEATEVLDFQISQWLWRDFGKGHWERVGDALEKCSAGVSPTKRHVLDSACDWMTLGAAARTLSLSSKNTIKFLIRAKVLREERPRWRVCRESVLSLRMSRDSLPLKKAARWLGLPESAVRELGHAGVLPYAESQRGVMTFTSQSLLKFLDALLDNEYDSDELLEDGKYVKLLDALRTLKRLGYHQATMTRLIRNILREKASLYFGKKERKLEQMMLERDRLESLAVLDGKRTKQPP